MNKLQEQILRGIKDGKIERIPAWRLLAHDGFFWVVATAATILGMVAWSVILHAIAIEQLPFAREVAVRESIPVIIQTLPYIWIGIFCVLLIAAWFNFKKTENAYKHQMVVVLVGLLLSGIGGTVLFALGVGGGVEERAGRAFPTLEQRKERRDALRQQFLERRNQNVERRGEFPGNGILRPPSPERRSIQ